jgi:GT2 family glycosyltransferase
MAFVPFPPRLLATIATLPDPAGYGLELLPFMRWLIGHMSVQQAVMIEDGRGLAAPVLAAALPADCALQRLVYASLPPWPRRSDIVHLTADVPADTLKTLLAQLLLTLSETGVVVLTAPGHRAALAEGSSIFLPLGDGVSLVASSSPPAVLTWLAELATAERQDLATLFDVMGRQIAVAAGLQGRAEQQAYLADRNRRASQRQQDKLASALQTEQVLLQQLNQAVAEQRAMAQSTSWKITAPLRAATTALARKLGRLPPPAVKTPKADPKIAFKEEAAKSLWDFLVSAERIHLPASPDPDVSILLVLYNQASLTLLCLQSIVATVSTRAAVEVIIVDNASSDETGTLLDRLEGARIIRNADNRHFLHAVNQAAEAAKGRNLLLLNNDARLSPGALQAAQRTLHSEPDIGAVGGKIILLDGTLQEAGSIVWQDGTCVGYGRGEPPNDPAFQFRRDVDFCSGAFLLIRGDVFRSLGGLDTAFAPAYYEEVDLCMRLHEAGYRVVYDPQVELTHYEFGSSASSEQAFELQRRHFTLFAERHAARLQQSHIPPTDGPLLARMPRNKPRILYLDDRVPYAELGAGYPRAARVLRELVAEGWFVTFYPVYFPEDDWASIYQAFPAEVEVILNAGRKGMEAFLAERDGYYDTILVSRPHNMRDFLKARGTTNAKARLIYDAEALFATREFLRLQQMGTPASLELRRATLKEEIALTETAAIVTTVNEHEADIFRGGGCADVRVLGLGVDPSPIGAGFSGRQDFLFVGSLDQNDSPNADAVIWFAEEIMPLIDARLGRPTRLLLAGRCAAPRIQALASDRIQVLGLVDDLTPLYASARVFIAPNRFAGGMPLKVQEAVSRGLPVVATELLGRQLGWKNDQELLLAATAAEFAAACAQLHEDPALWHRLRRQGLDRLSAEIRADDFTATLRGLLADPGRKQPV